MIMGFMDARQPREAERSLPTGADNEFLLELCHDRGLSACAGALVEGVHRHRQ